MLKVKTIAIPNEMNGAVFILKNDLINCEK